MAGGTNAVLANVAIDLARASGNPQSLARWPTRLADLSAGRGSRRRLKRVEQLGFDEILLVSQAGVLDEIERARDSSDAGLRERAGSG